MNKNNLIKDLKQYQLERYQCNVRIKWVSIAAVLTGIYSTYMFLFERHDGFGMAFVSSLITGGLIFYFIQLIDMRSKITRELDCICLKLFGKIYSLSSNDIININIE